MQRYRWRGNIRELRNTVERLLIMTPDDLVRVDDLPPELRSETVTRPVPVEPLRPPVRSFRRQVCPRRPRWRRAGNVARVQGGGGARLPGGQAARERLEHFQDG
jgi:DNA-binding NtrC family response regulator